MHPTVRLVVVAAAVAALAGCAMTESRVRAQITASEARTAAAQADLEDRLSERLRRGEDTRAAESERLRRDLEARAEADRRLVADALLRQREALLAQVRALDEAVAALLGQRPPLAVRP
jgi:hypothetical protein